MLIARAFLIFLLGIFGLPAMAGSLMNKSDDGPLFIDVRKRDPEFQAAITQAQSSLSSFRSLLSKQPASKGSFPLIKKYFRDGGGVWLWLIVIGENKDGFFGETFEAPLELTSLKPGTRLFITNEDVADWMLNNNGDLYGGFTLRLQRARLPVSERKGFDNHVGVERYLPLPP